MQYRCNNNANLREPEFIDSDTDLRINIYRGQISGGDGGKNGGNGGEIGGDDAEVILQQLRENPNISAANISKATAISKRTVERNLQKLKSAGIIKREGSTRNGRWIINDTE